MGVGIWHTESGGRGAVKRPCGAWLRARPGLTLRAKEVGRTAGRQPLGGAHRALPGRHGEPH